MAKVQKGYCTICGAELGKVAMKNHILKIHSDAAEAQDCVLIKAEGAYDKNYWLYFDAPATSTLSTVDRFLRKIWLECCGHMSGFMGPGYREVGKARKLGNFPAGAQLLHQYDYGSTTELIITFVGPTRRPAQREAVRLLARNAPFEYTCGLCGKPAGYVDVERMYDDDNPFRCRACVEAEEPEMLLPVTNSPRMGVCGYAGELDTEPYTPEKFRK